MIEAVLYELFTKNWFTSFINRFAAPSLIGSAGSSRNRTRRYNTVNRPCVILRASGGGFDEMTPPEARTEVVQSFSAAMSHVFNWRACPGRQRFTTLSPSCTSVCSPTIVELSPDTEQM